LIYDYRQTVNFAQSGQINLPSYYPLSPTLNTVKGSGLTHKQRSLVIIVIILLAYISLGSAVLSVMLKITFIDALYLSVVSIEGIGRHCFTLASFYSERFLSGFGDIHPTTSEARIFSCFYIAGGIINLALAAALSRETLLEAIAVGFQKRINAARARERQRHILTCWHAAVQWRLRSQGLPVWIDDHVEEREERTELRQRNFWYSSLRRFWRRLWDEVWREWEDPAWKYVYGPNQTRLNLEALSHSQLETAALETGALLSELVPKVLIGRNREQEDVNSPNSQFPFADTHFRRPSLTHMRVAGMVSLLAKSAVAVTHQAFSEEKITENSDETILKGSKPTGNDVPALTKSLTMAITNKEDQGDLTQSLEIEERNAFYARLGVACTLFLVFWMVPQSLSMY